MLQISEKHLFGHFSTIYFNTVQFFTLSSVQVQTATADKVGEELNQEICRLWWMFTTESLGYNFIFKLCFPFQIILARLRFRTVMTV